MTIPSREAWVALSYFAAYLGYLFVHPEGEIAHWLGLVLVPSGLLALIRRDRQGGFDPRTLLVTIGLRQCAWRTGLGWGLLAGLVIAPVQLFARDGAEVRHLLLTARGLGLVAGGFLLMLATAALTEEVFFRGILQTRLRQAFRTNWIAVPATAVLFSLYHWPYAYLRPQWPSHGDLAGALSASFATGLPLGLVLGGVFAKARENLLAPILAHALINTLPAMVWLNTHLR